MGIRLRQLPDGKWYKFGTGKPVEATPQEVAIWQAAQEETLDHFAKPRGIWGRISDLAKWSALLTGIVTFLVLYVDWRVVYGLCAELGVEELSFTLFSRNPVHERGVTALAEILLGYATGACIAWLFYRFYLSNLFKRSPQKAKRIFEVCFVVVSIGYLCLVMFGRHLDRAVELYLGYQVVTWASLFAWFATRGLSERLYGKAPASLMLLLITSVLIALTFPAGLLSLYPEAHGRDLAKRVLTGEAYLPATSLLVDRILPMSNQVGGEAMSPGEWWYIARVITNPETGNKVFSLQYLGADQNAIYLLDIGARTVHAVPRSAVRDLMLFTFSKDSWTAPDLDFPNYWATPVPAPGRPAEEP